MSNINWIPPIIAGFTVAALSPFYNKLFTKSTYESDWTTENGKYHVHIARMRAARPYLRVKITDKTREGGSLKIFRDRDLVQNYDEEKYNEVVQDTLKWYESKKIKKQ
jgi:hypothetical protein